MKKHVLLAGAALMFVATAFAEPPADKDAAKPAEPTAVHCAVMTDNKVNIKTATEKKKYADYKGNRYFFCCGGCPEAFAKDPEKYSKNDHIATPKEKEGDKAKEEKPKEG